MKERTVLIVDDDEELHTLYGMYLKGASFRILEAYHGQEAFEILAREKVDLIVLDMIMPVMDGETFLKKLHLDEKLKATPVLVASVNDKIAPELLEYENVLNVLKKPFNVESLTEAIGNALK